MVMATVVAPRAVTTIEPLPSSSVPAIPSATGSSLASLRAALAIPSPPEPPSPPRTLPMNELAGAAFATFPTSVRACVDRADPSRASSVPRCLMKGFSVNHPSPPARIISPAGFPLLPVLTTFRFRNPLIYLPKTPPLSRRSGLTHCFRSGIGSNTGSSSRSRHLPPRGGFSHTERTSGALSCKRANALHHPAPLRQGMTHCCRKDMPPIGVTPYAVDIRWYPVEFMGFSESRILPDVRMGRCMLSAQCGALRTYYALVIIGCTYRGPSCSSRTGPGCLHDSCQPGQTGPEISIVH